MDKKLPVTLLIALLALLVVVGGGLFAYLWFSGGSGEATGEARAEAVEPSRSQSVVYEVDNEVRDRTIRTLILDSNQDAYEFSTFEPTEVTGLPQTISREDTLRFQVTGDLTIRDVTSPVTFDMSLEVNSEAEVEGSASTTILWEDSDITIPYVGGDSIVASVEDQVDLEIDFVAIASGGDRESRD